MKEHRITKKNGIEKIILLIIHRKLRFNEEVSVSGMKAIWRILMSFYIFLPISLYAQTAPLTYVITKENLQKHVVFLSSGHLQGRLTGSQGEALATQYVAKQFAQMGLQPGGDHGTFFQTFDFSASPVLGKNNFFAITGKKGATKRLVLNKEWCPLSFSASQSFETAKLVFAGYGISSPDRKNKLKYDSYAGLHVKNKWVVVFRYLPEKLTVEERQKLNPCSSLRYKAFIAKEKGAKGIIFVNGPNAKVNNELIPFSWNTALSNAGIVAISVTNRVVNEWLANASHQRHPLKSLQDKLDRERPFEQPDLSGIKMKGLVNIQHKDQQACNVVAKLKIGKSSDPILIIGAHGDHLGQKLNDVRSEKDNTPRIHYGADDNASGVASVLEVAGKLSHLHIQNKLSGNKDILFVIWTGEELGLLGSGYFLKHMTSHNKSKPYLPIFAYINLDMVGRLKKSLILQGVGSSPYWPKLIKDIGKHHTIHLLTQADPYLPTDSTSFYLHHVPTLNFFTGAHSEYHTPRDIPSLINFDGTKRIANFLVDVVLTLEKKPHSMRFQQVIKRHEHIASGFNVYLGTIPDYASTQQIGVKLSGVRKKSPADLAGLREEDVIVELAGKKIHDIYDYTYVLNGLKIKEPVSLLVLRQQKKLALMIVPERRE